MIRSEELYIDSFLSLDLKRFSYHYYFFSHRFSSQQIKQYLAFIWNSSKEGMNYSTAGIPSLNPWIFLPGSVTDLSQILSGIAFFPEETRFPEKSVKPRNTQDLSRISNKTSLSFFKDLSGLSIRILIRKLNILMKT